MQKAKHKTGRCVRVWIKRERRTGAEGIEIIANMIKA